MYSALVVVYTAYCALQIVRLTLHYITLHYITLQYYIHPSINYNGRKSKTQPTTSNVIADRHDERQLYAYRRFPLYWIGHSSAQHVSATYDARDRSVWTKFAVGNDTKATEYFDIHGTNEISVLLQ